MFKIRTSLIRSVLPILLASNFAAEGKEADTDFRISGIMQLGAGSYKALVEFANGEKATVAPGDSLQTWKVVSISDNCMALTRDGKNREDCLTGSSEVQPLATPTNIKPALNKTGPDPSHFKQIDKDDLLKALDRLTDAKNIAQLSEAILPLVDISPDQQITQIEAQNISSVQDAIDLMRQAAEVNRPIRLSLVDQDHQMNVIYMATQLPAANKP